MSALPVLVGRVTARADVIERMRYELGETRVNEARPGSLRERYGIGGGVNVLHLSDSPESGARETELWSSRVSLDVLDANLDDAHDRPDHTFHLRSLAAQYGAAIHTELAAETIKRLLAEESDLPGDDFDALARVVLRAFRSCSPVGRSVGEHEGVGEQVAVGDDDHLAVGPPHVGDPHLHIGDHADVAAVFDQVADADVLLHQHVEPGDIALDKVLQTEA